MNKRAGRPTNTGNRLARATRINEIFKSLLDGTSNEADLAAKYGVTPRQIRTDIAEAMDRLAASTLTSTEEYRALQLARHEMYLAKINKELDDAIAAQAPASVINLYMNTGLKVMDQENKLATLYTTKFEVQQTTEIRYVTPVDQAAQMLAMLESQGLLPSPTVEAEYRELPSEIGEVIRSTDESNSNGEAVQGL